MARRIHLFVFLLAGWLALGLAAPPAAADPARFETLIRAQIEAFRQDDAVAAFGLASPAIQRQFGDPETFLSMVAAAYRPVYRPKRLVFLEVRPDRQGRPVQRVLVEGADGDTVFALYPMVRVGGAWRIDGCVLVRADGSGI
ncbi:MAG: DUF4864 domain-containing protein [Magnetovibrio sp.]|nr:DUF4864 domain-containing protein [Magnetovibrio sp.]